MAKSLLIKNARIVNEGTTIEGDIYIRDGRFHKIGGDITAPADQILDVKGKVVLPGVIDDQVHFREPGLTHKADLRTESRAAVAGGITSFMEMPNTNPQTLTQELLEEKYATGAEKSSANYSFFMGASNDNLEEVLRTNTERVCGIKVFMGSSTGNMLVDDERTLEGIFSRSPMLVATHCEKEEIIRENTRIYQEKYGDNIPIKYHPIIRSREACYASSSLAVSLAKKHNSRLHILHISTKEELDLFDNSLPLTEKRITAEACIHHLWFDDFWYEEKGTFIKWNPAVKTAEDREAIFQAVLDNRIDVIATDHAPHTLAEKSQPYMKAPSGGPLVQHALVAMLDFHHQGKITLERIAEKMSHAVADCFQIRERGYIREGYHADCVVVDLDSPWTVNRDNILYKCGWSPFEGHTFRSSVASTLVNGQLVFHEGKINEEIRGERLLFNR